MTNQCCLYLFLLNGTLSVATVKCLFSHNFVTHVANKIMLFVPCIIVPCLNIPCPGLRTSPQILYFHTYVGRKKRWNCRTGYVETMSSKQFFDCKMSHSVHDHNFLIMGDSLQNVVCVCYTFISEKLYQTIYYWMFKLQILISKNPVSS